MRLSVPFRILLTFFAAFLPLILLSQNPKVIIEKIEFEGLKKSKSSYLLRFLDHREGKEIDSVSLKKDLQRLSNLPTLTKVEARIDTSGKTAILTFEIEEAATLFPIVNFGGVRGNFWYQVGFNETHLLGTGKQLSAFYQNIDRRHNFNLFFRAPYLNASKFGFSVGLLRYASVEPLYFPESNSTVFFNYTNLSAGISGIYELNRRNHFELGLTFFEEDYKKNERHIGEITPGPEAFQQPKLLGKAIYRTDRINYHFFYLKGFDNVANFQTVFNLDEESLFLIFLNDTRYFKRIGKKGNVAVRFRAGISTNTDSPFAPFVLDSQINIRGSGNRIDRGTGALILNLEYRKTVYDKKRFAGQIVGFSDMGAWRIPGGEFSDFVSQESFRHFIGGGIRLINKKAFNAILRVDYGIDLYNFEERGAVLGIGQYF